MQLRHLFEGPTEDAAAYAKAEKAWSDLYGFIHFNKDREIGDFLDAVDLHVNGEVVEGYYLTFAHISALADFKDLLVMFYRDRSQRGGASAHMTNDGKPFVRVNLNTETTTDLLSGVYRASQEIIHEMIHILDFLRTKTPIGDVLGKSYTEITKSTNGYYNDPLEFNAYFNNFASRLISDINFMKSDPDPEIIDFLTPIERDFKEYLTLGVRRSMVASSGVIPTVKKWLSELNTGRDRSRIRRIYGLHQLYWELYDERKALLDQEP